MELCCDDLKKIVTEDPEDKDHTFFIEDRILRMVVSRGHTADGGLFFIEKPTMYCPFCGTRLQTAKSIAEKVSH